MRRLLCAVACALMVGACSSDPPEASVGRGTVTTTPAGPITFSVKSFAIEAVVPPAQPEREAAQAGVLTTLQAYLTDAVLAPLRSGAPAGDVGRLFSAASLGRATSAPDRAALFDEGLPVVSDIRSDAADLNLTGLSDGDGRVVVMTARVTLKLTGVAADTPVTVEHSGDFVLVPDGPTWKIDAYQVRASRDTPAGTVTTTAANG